MSSCVLFGADKYLTTQGNDEEADCDPWGTETYSAQQGQSTAATCLACGAGTCASQIGMSSCTLSCKCSSAAGASSAATCADGGVGKHSNTAGVSSCLLCDVGKCNDDLPPEHRSSSSSLDKTPKPVRKLQRVARNSLLRTLIVLSFVAASFAQTCPICAAGKHRAVNIPTNVALNRPVTASSDWSKCGGEGTCARFPGAYDTSGS